MQKRSDKYIQLKPVWNNVIPHYHLVKQLGSGAYGEVVHAKHRTTGRDVAIKLLSNIFQCPYATKKVVREVQILRLFTQMNNNIYVPKLYDVIAPTDFEEMTYLFIV